MPEYVPFPHEPRVKSTTWVADERVRVCNSETASIETASSVCVRIRQMNPFFKGSRGLSFNIPNSPVGIWTLEFHRRFRSFSGERNQVRPNSVIPTAAEALFASALYVLNRGSNRCSVRVRITPRAMEIPAWRKTSLTYEMTARAHPLIKMFT